MDVLNNLYDKYVSENKENFKNKKSSKSSSVAILIILYIIGGIIAAYLSWKCNSRMSELNRFSSAFQASLLSFVYVIYHVFIGSGYC